MTIDELIARLEEYRDALGGETEVRLMTQQNWPFENGITGLVSVEEMNDTGDEDDDGDEGEGFDPEGNANQVVYLVEGQQLGYGTKQAWNAAY